MPKIGRPDNFDNRSFRSIKMATKEQSATSPNKSVGNILNKMAGNNSQGIKYVDRKNHNKMGKNEFLRLLTIQLENQDPLKPVDQKKFAADLAQFSQLKQMSNMNTKLDAMGKNAPIESKFYGASFLGKKVLTSGASVAYNGDGRPVGLPFNLPNNAKDVIIRVFDEKGQNVAVVNEKGLRKGNNSIKWDGNALDGMPSGKGNYTFKVFAWDDANARFMGETKAEGIVSGVKFENGKTILSLENGRKIFLHDVEKFELPGHNKKVVNKNVAEAKNRVSH